jgi:peroxiredoxin
MKLPENLRVPTDDGAADHLKGMKIPSVPLESTLGGSVDLSKLLGCVVVFVYPRTGRPGEPSLVSDWDSIPGARGCTPQTCGFRDSYDEFRALGCLVYGISTQRLDYQREMVTRLHPFPVLSDEQLQLTNALRLPTFTAAGQVLLKRLALVAKEGTIAQVFYPVFPPDKSALTVLQWLRNQASRNTS